MSALDLILVVLLSWALVAAVHLFLPADFFKPIGCPHCGAPCPDERYRGPECLRSLDPEGKPR
jgi:hypothetical protein